MRWLVALVLALVMVTPAFAGEAPYFATVTHVGPFPDPPDISANYWYISPKHQQFLLNEVGFLGTDAMCWPISGTTQQCEQFKSLTPQNQPEVCFYDPEATDRSEPGNGKFPNAVVRAGNAGKFEWYVRLPRKPSGEINLVLECGVLKPNSFSFWKYRSIEMCAAETGERVGPNCTRTEVAPGTNPLITRALPTITAVAYPGPYNHPFTPFNLTAFRNPGS